MWGCPRVIGGKNLTGAELSKKCTIESVPLMPSSIRTKSNLGGNIRPHNIAAVKDDFLKISSAMPGLHLSPHGVNLVK